VLKIALILLQISDGTMNPNWTLTAESRYFFGSSGIESGHPRRFSQKTLMTQGSPGGDENGSDYGAIFIPYKLAIDFK
jgi:hypothetical protein